MKNGKYSTLNVLAVGALMIASATAQFPRACTTDEALDTRECCPVFATGDVMSKCGEEQGRGKCVGIQILKPELDDETNLRLILDERREWPRVLYDKACECFGNFDGVKCDRCQPGFTGENCKKVKQFTFRQNILQMPTNEVAEFVANLNKSKYTVSEEYVILTTSYDRIVTGEKPNFSNISVYDLFVWMHYYVARNNLVPDIEADDFNENILGNLNSNLISQSTRDFFANANLQVNEEQDYAHEGPAFLPWHRYFLLKWEEEFRRDVVQDPNFAIPYWDWRESDTCEVCTNEIFGARSDSIPEMISQDSVFSKWSVICTQSEQADYILKGKQCDGSPEGPLVRNHGSYDPEAIRGLPTAEDVENTLKFSRYETFPYNIDANSSFRNVIEGFADPRSGDSSITYSTMHNAVHLYMNGTMSEVSSSANDPIFIVHHAFIDSLYEIWLQDQTRQQLFLDLDENQANMSVGHNLQDFMVPFFPLVRQIEGFRTTKELGYKYDYLENEMGSALEETIPDDVEDDFSELLDYIYEEYVEKPEERFVAEGHFEAVASEGVNVCRKRLIATRRRLSRVRYLKKTHNLLKKKNNAKENKLVGEGGIKLRFENQEKQVSLLKSQESRLVDIGIEINSMWDKMVSYVYDFQQYFTDVSVGDKIMFLFIVSMAIACIFIWVAMCCSCRSEVASHSKKHHCCKLACWKSEAKYDDEECQSLLETCEDGKVKRKIVQGKSYTYEEEGIPLPKKVKFDEI